jgi:hypothetical protein
VFPMQYIVQPIQVSWQAQEVVREIAGRPHLLLRVTIRGGYFPQRALVPWVRLAAGEAVPARAWFTEISDDSNELRGYFPTDVSLDGTVEYGYGPQVYGRALDRFDAGAVTRLDRGRLPTDVIDTTRAYLAKIRE